MLGREKHCSIDLILKLCAESDASFFVPENRVLNIPARCASKRDRQCHFLRRSSKEALTSSHGTTSSGLAI